MTIDDVRSRPRLLLQKADLWTDDNRVRQPLLDGVDPWVNPTPNRQIVGDWIVWNGGAHFDRATRSVVMPLRPSSILHSLWAVPRTTQGVDALIGSVGDLGLCPCGQIRTDAAHAPSVHCNVPPAVALQSGIEGRVSGVHVDDVLRWCRRLRAVLTLAAHARVAFHGRTRKPDDFIPFLGDDLSFVRLRGEADVSNRWPAVVPTEERFIDGEVVTVVGNAVSPDGPAPPAINQWLDVGDIIDDWLRINGVRYSVAFRHHEVQGADTIEKMAAMDVGTLEALGANIVRRGRLTALPARNRSGLSLVAVSLARLLGSFGRDSVTCVHCGNTFEPRHKTSGTAPVCFDDACRRARASAAARRSRAAKSPPQARQRR